MKRASTRAWARGRELRDDPIADSSDEQAHATGRAARCVRRALDFDELSDTPTATTTTTTTLNEQHTSNNSSEQEMQHVHRAAAKLRVALVSAGALHRHYPQLRLQTYLMCLLKRMAANCSGGLSSLTHSLSDTALALALLLCKQWADGCNAPAIMLRSMGDAANRMAEVERECLLRLKFLVHVSQSDLDELEIQTV